MINPCDHVDTAAASGEEDGEVADEGEDAFAVLRQQIWAARGDENVAEETGVVEEELVSHGDELGEIDVFVFRLFEENEQQGVCKLNAGWEEGESEEKVPVDAVLCDVFCIFEAFDAEEADDT